MPTPTQEGTASTKQSAAGASAGRRLSLSRTRKPADMSLEEWQTELRRQFGREQKFLLKNLGTEPVFSEFQVSNPQSRNTYRVAVRGPRPGDNFCSCPDFLTNTLGTCKHIEFTLARLARRRGTLAALRAGFHPPYSEVYLEYGARRQVRLRLGRDCPPALAVLAADYFDKDRRLREDAFARFETFLAKAAESGHDLRCYDDVINTVAEVRDAAGRQTRIDAAFPQGIGSKGFDGLLKVPLYDYQREGALFAARAGRCLIGDDMGLGKTIQAIAAAEILARSCSVERVLVICPTSLKHQWQREIERFSGRSAQVIGGGRTARHALYGSESFYKIANYDTIHRDLEAIAGWSPDLVILDEAQRIKNWNTRAARSVKRIASPHAIVLTGTPLENRLQELVSIVEFVDRWRLGPTFAFLDHHQLTDEHGRVVGYRNLDSIGKTLAPILIRRHKDQVLKQLPARLDKTFFVPMTPQQMEHHEENRETVARVVAKWRRYGFLSEADQIRLTCALQNMRMSCDSTYLLDRQTDFGVKADELATLLEEIYDSSRTKVVIFSQWVRMHEVLVRRLAKRGWGHVLFNGSIPSPKRQALIDRFREDEQCRAFLSTDAGGVGLNLQHASVVVNVDLPWNPAVLEQRIGRVHRLGQKQPVRVVNFVAQGTIEEGMLSLLKFKRSLFAGVLDGGQSEIFMGGTRLKQFMEGVEKATTSIPQATIEEDGASDGESGSESQPASQVVPAASLQQAAADPWSMLLQSGLAVLQQLTAAAPRSGERGSAGPGLSLVHRDSDGQSYLKLPLPKPEALQGLLQALGTFLEQIRSPRA